MGDHEPSLITAPSILEAWDSPDFFGPIFGPSWAAWRVFVRGISGLPLSPTEQAVFHQHTGRITAPSSPIREAWALCGRRAGKSQVASALAVWFATQDYAAILAPGEKATIPIIAADRKQARVCFRYVMGLLESVPVLQGMIVRPTQDSVELSTRVIIEVHTCSFRSIRGYSVPCAIADEISFWRDENSSNPDTEILAGLRPAMMTFPHPLLLCVSTPYARRGAAWQAFRDHYGREDDPILVWTGDTQSMNPLVDPALIEQAYRDDPQAASAEYGAIFRSDVEEFISEEVLDRVTVPGRRELPPVMGTRYAAFVDPSGGSQDSFALGIAHRDQHGACVLDLIREVKAPFNPSEVVESFSAILTRYGITSVTGDHYAGEWPTEAFSKNKIAYRVSERTKSEIYLESLPLFTSGKVELPEDRHLLSQFRGLERKTTRAGRDSVDHGPGGRDDLANSAAGALLLVKVGTAKPMGGALRGSGPFGPLTQSWRQGIR